MSELNYGFTEVFDDAEFEYTESVAPESVTLVNGTRLLFWVYEGNTLLLTLETGAPTPDLVKFEGVFTAAELSEGYLSDLFYYAG